VIGFRMLFPAPPAGGQYVSQKCMRTTWLLFAVKPGIV